MNSTLKVIAVAVALLSVAVHAEAQKVGLKTNLLSWATTTPNIGVEVALSPKTTLDIKGACNIPGLVYFGPKELNCKIWHWSAQPEFRFWLTEAFNRGFLGVHATTGAFNVAGIDMPLGFYPELKDHRFEGWMLGMGISYGWQWWVSPHWNFEATFGFGYLYLEYNRFDSPASATKDQINAVDHYFGPTKIGLSFSYLFGSKK